jgi:hypothetical protein
MRVGAFFEPGPRLLLVGFKTESSCRFGIEAQQSLDDFTRAAHDVVFNYARS